jgi:hypothetical protein
MRPRCSRWESDKGPLMKVGALQVEGDVLRRWPKERLEGSHEML